MRRKIDAKQKEILNKKLKYLYNVLSGITAALQRDEITHYHYFRYSSVTKQFDELYKSGFKYKKEG